MSPAISVFINKTATGNFKGNSTHEERRLINRQNRSHRRPQERKLILLGEDVASDKAPESERSNDAWVQDVSSKTSESSTDKSPKGTKRKTHNVSSPTAAQSLVSVLPSTTFGKSAVDPFDAWANPLDERIVPYLQYYQRVQYHVIWKNSRRSFKYRLEGELKNICSPMKVITDCLQNKTRMSSLIANMARNMEHVENIRFKMDSLRLMQNALEGLSLEIRRKTPNLDEDILITAYHLCLASAADQNIDVIKVHTRGIRAIVNRMLEAGRLPQFPIIALLSVVDTNLSDRCLEFTSKPWQLEAWMHEMENAEKLRYRATLALPQSLFLHPKHAAFMTSDLSSTVTCCLRFTAQHQLLDKTTPPDAKMQRFLDNEQQSLSQRIVETDTEDGRAKCLLQGLLTWTWLASPETRKSAAIAAERLKEKLFDMIADTWGGHEAVLLWLCIVGAMAAEPTFTQRYFVRRTIILQNILNLEQSEREEHLQRRYLRSFARDYLWLDEVQDSLLDQISWVPNAPR